MNITAERELEHLGLTDEEMEVAQTGITPLEHISQQENISYSKDDRKISFNDKLERIGDAKLRRLVLMSDYEFKQEVKESGKRPKDRRKRYGPILKQAKSLRPQYKWLREKMWAREVKKATNGCKIARSGSPLEGYLLAATELNSHLEYIEDMSNKLQLSFSQTHHAVNKLNDSEKSIGFAYFLNVNYGVNFENAVNSIQGLEDAIETKSEHYSLGVLTGQVEINEYMHLFNLSKEHNVDIYKTVRAYAKLSNESKDDIDLVLKLHKEKGFSPENLAKAFNSFNRKSQNEPMTGRLVSLDSLAKEERRIEERQIRFDKDTIQQDNSSLLEYGINQS